MDRYSWTGGISVFFTYVDIECQHMVHSRALVARSCFFSAFIRPEVCLLVTSMWSPPCEAASLHFNLNYEIDFPGHLRFCYNHKWEYQGFCYGFYGNCKWEPRLRLWIVFRKNLFRMACHRCAPEIKFMLLPIFFYSVFNPGDKG